MRWSIIRLIWLRELRDQLRDRRTVFTSVALPLLLYPAISLLVMQFARQLLNQPSTIGVLYRPGEPKDFPRRPAAVSVSSIPPALSWLALTPAPSPTSLDRVIGTAALAQASHLSLDYFLLIEDGEVTPLYRQAQKERLAIFAGEIQMEFRFVYGSAGEALQSREIDLVLAAPDDFLEKIQRGEQAHLQLVGRPNDDRSRRAAEQLAILLGRWENHLKQVRLRARGLPDQFDDPFTIHDANLPRHEEIFAAETLLDLLVRTFPFLLVMWSLVGALHPAIDLCAGEKEHGTMETLLISPAGREEIVYGKFLTIWVFSAGTAIMHLLGMFLSTWPLREPLLQGAVTLQALAWCTALALPLSALFSAVCLAVGAYARSSKEGQNYLMPMFWVTMPLVLLTMVPGVELNQFYSMVPVTGVALLMQRLMIAPDLATLPWFYFPPVFGTIVLYSWLALRWAIWQFQREEVLFREAERLQVGLWFRHLFRHKDALPSLGQALFCFGLLLGFRWLTEDMGHDLPVMARNSIVLLAFVAAPPLFMGLLLTTRPRYSLGLHWPRLGYVLAGLLFLPLAELSYSLLTQFPALLALFQGRRSLAEESYRQLGGPTAGHGNFDFLILGYEVSLDDSLLRGAVHWGWYFLILVLLPAVCKEVAFRGFILNGLRQRLSPWPAILLSSFLFAAYHMNVFALVPLFLMGLVTGVLAVRSGSLLPGIVLHMGCQVLLLRGSLLAGAAGATEVGDPTRLPVLAACTILCTGLAGLLLWRLGPAVRKGSAPVMDGPARR